MPTPLKPKALKVLTGTFRKDRDGNAPEAEPKAPACPDWLPPSAKKYWKEMAPQLEKLGLIGLLDSAAFAAHCDSVGHYAEISRRLQSYEDMLDDTPQGFRVQSALFTIRNRLWDQIVKSAKEFGLSPAARANPGLKSAGKPEPKGDWEDI